MKTTRRAFAIMMVMVLAFALVAACQTIDGACWLPDSQGNQGVGAGGPILPAGVGGYGDTPPGDGGYGADYVPCPTQEPAPLSATTCPVVGKACVDLCMAEANKWCPSFAEHPPKQGLGALIGCCGCKGTGYCEFVWGANERCRWYETGQWLCF